MAPFLPVVPSVPIVKNPSPSQDEPIEEDSEIGEDEVELELKVEVQADHTTIKTDFEGFNFLPQLLLTSLPSILPP